MTKTRCKITETFRFYNQILNENGKYTDTKY